jgi:GTPase SAR1 family protein
LQIWDTAGQERFRTITTAYYRGAMGILLVYDVSDMNSFESVRNWMRQIDQNAAENVNRILIGNKCDVDPSERKVSYDQGKELADEFDIKFFETSAKLNNDTNDDNPFLSIARDMVERSIPHHYCSKGEFHMYYLYKAIKNGDMNKVTKWIKSQNSASNINKLDTSSDYYGKGFFFFNSKGYFNTTKKNTTPLMYACFCEETEIVKYLLDNGADISIKNQKGY